MSPEERKEYNKIYYQQKIEKLKNNEKTHTICTFCDRKVTTINLQTHYKTPYCKRHYDFKILSLDRLKKIQELQC